MKPYFILIALTLLLAANGKGQVQWFPAVKIDNKYVRDTTKARYPVSNIIQENGQVNLYGRGTRYPTAMKFNKKSDFFYVSEGILMTSRRDNLGYHSAAYEFRKKDEQLGILKIVKKDKTTEEIIFVRSLLPVKYPTGN